MSKSARRKRRRKQKGTGDRTASHESSETKYGASGAMPARSEAILERRAIANGWIKPEQGQRFETRTPHSDIEAKKETPDELTIIDKLTIAVNEQLQSNDERTRGIAAKLAVTMERANQLDEHKSTDAKRGKDGDGGTQQHVHLHQHAVDSIGPRSGIAESPEAIASRTRLLGLIAEAKRRNALAAGDEQGTGTATIETVGVRTADQPA